MPAWRIDRSRILSLAEIAQTISDQKKKAKRSKTTTQRLIIFRLATCCGLRVGELVQLRVGDIQEGERPHIRVRAATTKGDNKGRRHGRSVPLWWDIGTLMDVIEWKRTREADGAKPGDLFVSTRKGTMISRGSARLQYRTACKCLGKHVTIHDGRHTFISHMLAVGRSIKAVADAAGHVSISATSIYTHLCPEYDDGRPIQLFGPTEPDRNRQAAIAKMHELGLTAPNLTFGLHQSVPDSPVPAIATDEEFEHKRSFMDLPPDHPERVAARLESEARSARTSANCKAAQARRPKRLYGIIKTRHEARLAREAAAAVET